MDTKSPRDDVVVGLETSVRSVASAAKHTALSKAQSNADFCSIDDWMAQWQMLAMHRPVLVQVCCYIDIEEAAYVIDIYSSNRMTLCSLLECTCHYCVRLCDSGHIIKIKMYVCFIVCLSISLSMCLSV